jgi:hypothetical protein
MRRQRIGRIFRLPTAPDKKASSGDDDASTLFLVIVIACLTSAILVLCTPGAAVLTVDQINLLGP